MGVDGSAKLFIILVNLSSETVQIKHLFLRGTSRRRTGSIGWKSNVHQRQDDCFRDKSAEFELRQLRLRHLHLHRREKAGQPQIPSSLQ